MYKILIVEDENLERNVLKAKLSAEFHDTISLMDTDNGETALELAVEYRPDIVLMDIHLGSTNGIDISRQILEEVCTSRIIILTAYDYFEYARQAVKLGVKEFLLKPVNDHDLFLTVHNLLSEIEDANRELASIKAVQENYERVKPVIKDALVTQVMNDTVCGTDIAQYVNSINGQWASACVALMDFSESGEILTPPQRLMLKNKILEIFSSAADTEDMLFDIKGSKYLTVLVFKYKAKDESNLQQRMEDIEQLQRMINLVAKSIQIDLRVGTSERVRDFSKLGDAYRQALFSINHGHNIINHYSDLMGHPQTMIYPKNYEELILRELFMENRSRLDLYIEEFFNAITAFSGKNIEVKSFVLQLLVKVLSEVTEKFNEPSPVISESVSSYMMNFAVDEGITMLKNNVKKILFDINNTILFSMEKKSNFIVERAKEYIKNNYTKDLMLDDISEHLKISSYYLSRIFKKEMGMNLIDYILTERIDHSKELLSGTEALIKEISIQVGFSDPNYFCKVFRKIIGVTATEYRNMNRNKKASML